jgi:hypothetical protein
MSKNTNLSKLAEMLSEELKKSKQQEIIESQSEPAIIDDPFNRDPRGRVHSYAKSYLSNNSKMKTMTEQKDSLAPLNQKFVTFEQMNRHYSDFLQKIQTQLSSLGGGGEVNFRYLDDVNRATMTNSDNNHVLEYDAATGKVQFTDEIGPIELIRFDLDHAHDEERIPGTLCWDSNDQTLNLIHPGGVTQQIGQESYALVRNKTGSNILNGTPVMFAGSESDGNGEARLLVTPIIANGSFPSLYGLGVATQDLIDGQEGKVTVWGKVRGLNTNSFEVGDILYADPSNAGTFTNVKPTAPNNVTPFGVVLRKSEADGEIFVRPTLNIQMYYGRFSRLTDFTVENSNEDYSIPFDTTDISNGIVLNGGSDTQIKVPDSGFYQFDVSAQVSASSNKGIVYLWFRKNGVDIPHSTRATTVTNGDTFNLSTSIQISLDANDYVELIFAQTAAGIFLDASTPSFSAPETASIVVNVSQIHL